MKLDSLRLTFSTLRVRLNAREQWTDAITRRSGTLGLYLPLLMLVVIAIVLRLWLISVNAIDPRFSNADDGDYYRRALRLAVSGQYVDDAWLIRPPLHVFFFAAWLWLALSAGLPQHGVLVVQLAQVGIGALTVLLGFDIAWRLFSSQRAGWLFAGFLAVWFPFVEMPTVLFSELLYLFLFLLHVWLLLRFDTTGRKRHLVLAGLALGAGALTRSPALYSLAFVAVWLLLRPMPTGQPRTRVLSLERLAPVAGQWLLVALCTLAVVGPWTLRNYLVYQRFIPVDTLGQINLWLDLDRVDRRDLNIDRLRDLPQADRAAYAMEQAREILERDPLRLFRGIGLTFRHIWKAQFFEDLFVKQSLFARPLREAAPLGLLGDGLWLVFTLAGLVGLAGPVREGWHNRLFVLAWLSYLLLTVLVFHVEPRYLLPIWTLIGLYGAGTLARIRVARQQEQVRSHWLWATYMLPGLVTLAFLWLVVTYRDYPALLARGLARESASIAGDQAYRRSDYAAAEAYYREALAAQPDFVDGQVSLALALAAQGRREEALALVTRNTPRGGSRRADLVYGALLRDTGKLDEARKRLRLVEQNAGEDVQRWALEWLRPAATADLRLGDGLDLGYIAGFSAAEGEDAQSFRWLEGTGRLALPVAAPLPAGGTVALRMTGGLDAITPLEVRIGAGPAHRIEVVRGQWRWYRLPIPTNLAGARQIVVDLHAPTVVPARRDAASDDARALSLMMSEVRVE